jgi:shikimate dehydrogenase
MNLYGLIGFPLTHSFSKKYFNEKFERERISDSFYELFPIERIDLFPSLINEHPQLRGINITIPYKEKVLPYLNQFSKDVKEIGACNCIDIKEGQLIGYNTDVIAFERSLQPLLKPHHTKALVLGTGGASKAIEWGLKKLKIEAVLVSRTASTPRISYNDLNEGIIKTHTLIINTTPLGMQPNINTLPSLPYSAITEKHICYDLVYNPEKTVFLAAAEKQGAVIKNGLEMLHIQAEESWKIWNG